MALNIVSSLSFNSVVDILQSMERGARFDRVMRLFLLYDFQKVTILRIQVTRFTFWCHCSNFSMALRYPVPTFSPLLGGGAASCVEIAAMETISGGRGPHV